MSKPFLRRLFCGLALCLSAGLASAEGYANVCLNGINIQGEVDMWACVYSDTGYAGSGPVQQLGEWGVSGSRSGEYRGGAFSDTQSASLATGLMRSTLLYASGPDDQNEYQLGTYISMSDELHFSGSGSATFLMHLSGSFLGNGHLLYPNTMDTALDFYSASRGTDVAGRINLANKGLGGLASFAPGSTCDRNFGLGRVDCTVHSLASGAIAIDMAVTVNNISDGEVLSFYSALNVQAYGPRGGGTDFGNTARLSVTLSDGLSFSSASGSFLSAVPAVPEPQSWLLMVLGLAGLAARRQRVVKRSAARS